MALLLLLVVVVAVVIVVVVIIVVFSQNKYLLENHSLCSGRTKVWEALEHFHFVCGSGECGTGEDGTHL